MTLSLSGTLRDPLGNALAGATVMFRARTTSEYVLQGVSAEGVTDAQGAYSLTVAFGRYDLYVQPDGVPYQRIALARGIAITSETTATSLNALIADQQAADDATPQIVLDMRAVAADTRGYRDDAALSESNAADSEAAADQHRIDAEAARDAATVAGQVYADTAAGLAATSDGQYFKTPAASAEGFLTLYRNDAGSATEIETFPSLNGLTAAIRADNEKTTRLNRSFSVRPYNGESLRADFEAQAYGLGDTTGISRAVGESDMFTVQRATPKWVFQPVADGAIQLVEVPPDTLAHEWDPVTGKYLGVLNEPSRTNLLPDSEFGSWWARAMGANAGNATLEVVNSTIHSGSMLHVIADDPVYGARTEGAEGSIEAGKEYAASVLIIPGIVPPSRLEFRFENASVNWESAVDVSFNPSTGEVFSGDEEVLIDPVGDGYLIRTRPGTCISSEDGNGTINFQINTSINLDESGTDFYVALPKLEKGAIPTSYIATAGSAATRAGDVINRENGSEFLQQYFTLLAEFASKESRSGENVLMLGYSDNRVDVRVNRAILVSSGSVLQTGVIGGDGVLAVSVSPDEIIFAKNGLSESSPNALAIPNLNILNVATSSTGGDRFNGHIKRLEYYPRAMSATELEALTA